MLSNLFDDSSLEYFDSSDEEIREDYDLLKEHLIEHYDTPNPMTTQWNNLNQRKQRDNESVTQYYDDLIKMGRRMDIAGANLIYIFINGLPSETKLHLSLYDPP